MCLIWESFRDRLGVRFYSDLVATTQSGVELLSTCIEREYNL